MPFKIVQKQNNLAVYAAGFYTIEAAKRWLKNYNPKMWTDKTITVDQLEIVQEK